MIIISSNWTIKKNQFASKSIGVKATYLSLQARSISAVGFFFLSFEKQTKFICCLSSLETRFESLQQFPLTLNNIRSNRNKIIIIIIIIFSFGLFGSLSRTTIKMIVKRDGKQRLEKKIGNFFPMKL